MYDCFSPWESEESNFEKGRKRRGERANGLRNFQLTNLPSLVENDYTAKGREERAGRRHGHLGRRRKSPSFKRLRRQGKRNQLQAPSVRQTARGNERRSTMLLNRCKIRSWTSAFCYRVASCEFVMMNLRGFSSCVRIDYCCWNLFPFFVLFVFFTQNCRNTNNSQNTKTKITESKSRFYLTLKLSIRRDCKTDNI